MSFAMTTAAPRLAELPIEHFAFNPHQLGRAAIASLYAELELAPKPGLVSFVDQGSHDDMDARTFMRSMFALRHYFPAIALAGARQLPFATLRSFGVNAEQRMLQATGGINTHRGAIFVMGLLCAAAGACAPTEVGITPERLRSTMMAIWGQALEEHAAPLGAPSSHGQRASAELGVAGARQEAADGFPTVFCVALPALVAARAQGLDSRRALLQAFFSIMAVTSDTNLVHRGGVIGLHFAQTEARSFLEAGGAHRSDALDHARSIHRAFVRRRLSPGGSADLLAAASFVHRICVKQ
jgi:triphosphoribosyl-dephospho-CoA synthase